MKNKKNRELLFSVTKADFKRITFRCGGPGGQNVNKVETGVRYIHTDSGAVGESREERKQGQNDKIAWDRCINSKEFQIWHKKRTTEELLKYYDRKSIEQLIDESMDPANLKIEIKVNGKWVEVNGSDIILEG